MKSFHRKSSFFVPFFHRLSVFIQQKSTDCPFCQKMSTKKADNLRETTVIVLGHQLKRPTQMLPNLLARFPNQKVLSHRTDPFQARNFKIRLERSYTHYLTYYTENLVSLCPNPWCDYRIEHTDNRTRAQIQFHVTK